MLATTKDGKQRAGVMVPIPQYPLYSATLSEFNNYQASSSISSSFLKDSLFMGRAKSQIQQEENMDRNRCLNWK